MLDLHAPHGGALALVFLSAECPMANAYSATLNELAAAFPKEKLAVVGLFVDPDSSDTALAAHAKEFRLAFPVARDLQLELARRFGVKLTPEAVLFDERGAVRYRGRIDDQYAARQTRRLNPRTHELRDAIAAVLAFRDVVPDKVEAIGCPLPNWPAESKAVTYSHDVARIFQAHCQECHRPGQVGPFSLMSYRDAAKRAHDIASVVEERRMPPWKPAPGLGPKFKHDRSLSDVEIASVIAWSEAGAPEGNAADLPPPAQFPDGWALGTPDLVLEPDTDFQIPADGKDIYRCFVIPTDLPQDQSISAIEYHPGNRRVVHHILAYVDVTGKARERDKADDGPGYMCFSGPGIEVHGDLGGWAPGNEPSRLPDGVGRVLPRKADVVMQVHYHPSGKPETDRTRIALYFSRKPIKQTLHWAAAAKWNLVLPPGESDIRVKGYPWKVPVDVEALAVTPHMHMLGKSMTMMVTYPDGRTEPLVKIDDWDFGWQNTYYFGKPIFLPAGTKLNVEARFDNSATNPRNPSSPPKEVRWGEATTDEMCIGFIAVTKAGQDLTRAGEVDDLRTIIDRSYEEQRKKRRERERGEESQKP
jgi:mono/diheme cytochrome c family protein